MKGRPHISSSTGFCLIELLLAFAVMGVCLALGAIAVCDGLPAHGARGAAQAWQSAAAWAQVGVLWQGGTAELTCVSGNLTAAHDLGLCGGDLGKAAPEAGVATNLGRWVCGQGVAVSFGGTLGSPNGGGSLYFGGPGPVFRVVVRPESGLTLRSREDEGP